MNRVYSYFLYLFIILNGIAGSAGSQQILTKSFDIRSEGSRPKFTRLFRDRDGLLWTGTDKGIFTFDGLAFSKINGSDSLNFGSVTAIYEDKSGTIWVGYESGKLITIVNDKLSPFLPMEGLPKAAISDFQEDVYGQLFFSTRGEGVYVYTNKRIYNFDHDDGLSDNFCYSMAHLPDGRMCVGTDEGINFIKFTKGIKNISKFTFEDGLPDDIVRTVAIDDRGKLWLGFQEAGIAQFDYKLNRLTPSGATSQWANGQVNKILPMQGELWITTEENGVWRLNRYGNLVQEELQDQKVDKPGDIVNDLENNIWISESIHLFRTAGSKLSLLQKIDTKRLSFIHCILSDHEGNLWFCPDNFLSKLSLTHDGKVKFDSYTFLNPQNPADVVTLYEDKYGFIWIGTLGEGVYRLNPKTGKTKQVTEKTNIEGSSILSITGDGDDIWIGGFNGVVKMTIASDGNSDNPQFTLDNKTAKGLSNDYVYSIFIDSKKRIWFGTDEHGAYVLDKDRMINLPVNGGAVHSFTEDREGRIWFTIPDAGIASYSHDSLSFFTTKNGLSDPSPSTIYCAKNGKLIIVHSNGFDVMDPSTHLILYHSTEENLADINSDLNSITESSDSTIWIGTERGILRYRPFSDMNITSPQLDFHGVYIFNDLVINGRSKFSSDENNLRFDYSGLWYSDPQRVNYSVMLEGYSTKWVNTKDHAITFAKLPPAKYTFRIRASLNSDFSNSKETSFTFIIEPPFWQRWWFRIALATLVIIIVIYIVKKRENRIRKIDLLQKQNIEFQFETLKNQVNPHFLFNSFNTLINVIETTPEMATEYVEKLSEFFRSIVSYREKSLISLKEELELVSNYIFIQKKRYGKSLELINDLKDEQIRGTTIPPLTLQLLAENAIKHNAVSKETPLKIEIFVSDNKIVVSNNINPKINKETSEGVGLQNIIS
ncbi:MAG: histidine kinase [Bacteroidetes bacterium]|nr:histidine kinase [Bacteroidota bacterium]